ncbi:two-component system response regulator [Clostridia bacterium]|nr:two-component system response regulator [Clostridia bacterium]
MDEQQSAPAHKMIMLVDDNQTNLKVGKLALGSKYNVFTIPSAAKMFKLLQKAMPDLILLDIEMEDMNGFEAIRLLKKDPATANIPVIFLSAKTDSASELEGLSSGAIDYIQKPFSPPLLLKRIEMHILMEDQKRQINKQNREMRHMLDVSEKQQAKINAQNVHIANMNKNLQGIVEQKTQNVINLQNAILKTVADLVECRDDVTGGHIERTQRTLDIMLHGVDLFKDDPRFEPYLVKLSRMDKALLVQSAQLHDVGKISIRDSVLLKPGKLTDEEFNEMKKHTTYGVSILEKIESTAGASTSTAFLFHAKVFAGTHHEKWNGAGYPYGLAGDAIPLQGRIMAISDVYDALVSVRPYKKAFSHEDACQIIREGSGTQFDPLLVEVFEQVKDDFRDFLKENTTVAETSHTETKPEIVADEAVFVKILADGGEYNGEASSEAALI